MPARGVETKGATTWDDPKPSVTGWVEASAPITATEPTWRAERGRSPDAFFNRTADCSAVVRANWAWRAGSTGVPGVPVAGPPDHAVREHLGQDPLDVVVDGGEGEAPVDEGLAQFVPGPGLEQLDSGGQGPGLVVDRPEVGADEAGEAPLLEEETEGGVLALERAVEPRVGAHQRGHVGLGHRRLERRR